MTRLLLSRLRFFCLLVLAVTGGTAGDVLAHGGAHRSAGPAAGEQPLAFVSRADRGHGAPVKSVVKAIQAFPGAVASSHCPSAPGVGCGCGGTACAGPAVMIVHQAGLASIRAAIRTRPDRRLHETPQLRSFLLVTSAPRAPPLLSPL